mmetsp:Transcript_38572/g.39260  ORF Transcript_38572/g.39260 Transcript_38572/m.39260 type:complete len:173 (-) Transcript_38572:451-969(-)
MIRKECFGLISTMLLIINFIAPTDTIKCNVGYGQRGRYHESGLDWPRICPTTSYCWEATTRDISQMKRLFDPTLFNWDSYYRRFYIHGCGGDYGTPLRSPCLVVPRPLFMNITTTGTNSAGPPAGDQEGSTELLSLNYCCTSDFCSDSIRLSTSFFSLSLFTIMSSFIVYFL